MPRIRVKSGIFEQTAKFGQRPCLFHISNIGIKNKLTKQTVKILDETAHKEPSHLGLRCLQMCVRIYLMSEFTRFYPTIRIQTDFGYKCNGINITSYFRPPGVMIEFDRANITR